MSRAWKYKVVKSMRGNDGRYFDYPTARTFVGAEAALSYAEDFAKSQGASRAYGARIKVIQRLGGKSLAVYRSDDYMPKARTEDEADIKRDVAAIFRSSE